LKNFNHADEPKSRKISAEAVASQQENRNKMISLIRICYQKYVLFCKCHIVISCI